ncbi:MAG TPA: hypothetical protein VKA34_17765 [Balneolales bacterium]|nr:hypothetical protein [Balneolales bacterium]
MKNGLVIFFTCFFAAFLFLSCNNQSDKKKEANTQQQVSKTDIKTDTITTGHKVEPMLKTISKDTLSHLERIEMPNTANIAIHQAYITSMEKVKYNGKKVLLVRGHLPDGCSKLYHVTKSIDDQTLTLTINTWKPKHKVCTQALKPFTFIYDGLGYFEFKDITHYKINSTVKAF